MFCRWVCWWQDNQAGWNGLAGGRACRARAFGVLDSLEGFGGCIWALWPLGPSAEQAQIRVPRVHSRGNQGVHRASHRRCRPLIRALNGWRELGRDDGLRPKRPQDPIRGESVTCESRIGLDSMGHGGVVPEGQAQSWPRWCGRACVCQPLATWERRGGLFPAHGVAVLHVGRRCSLVCSWRRQNASRVSVDVFAQCSQARAALATHPSAGNHGPMPKKTRHPPHIVISVSVISPVIKSNGAPVLDGQRVGQGFEGGQNKLSLFGGIRCATCTCTALTM